jgi:hypothetical protein
MHATSRPQNLGIFSSKGDDPILLDSDKKNDPVDKASRGNLGTGTKDILFRRRRRRRAASEFGPGTNEPTERRIKRQRQRHIERTSGDLQDQESVPGNNALATQHSPPRRLSSPIPGSSDQIYTDPIRKAPNSEASKKAQSMLSLAVRSADDMDTFNEQQSPSAYSRIGRSRIFTTTEKRRRGWSI